MKLPLRRPLDEVSEISGIPSTVIVHFIEEEWVNPIDQELRMLDEEDVCRILLIHDLQEKFGVNDEAVPVILHLVDQLNFIIDNSHGDSL
ncbi:MerR family transcriptional regulator [Bacteriovorax sp. PP10]|uniref:MerR family transcriptional regulator n=1 Tax=Bacteriovorax antarcticus TaxID=3088717 RepID=A0ABU5VWH2_9BACT|nr:MerR family transcriptional regulator [Bacteriovorax sp. PP10]MEA9357415.1 MerR family transcriptional regulator [Bacteriovorax sp. PP10]